VFRPHQFNQTWIAGSRPHFPRLGGRKKNLNKNVASGISEQEKEASMISQGYLYFRQNLKANAIIIFQLEVNKMLEGFILSIKKRIPVTFFYRTLFYFSSAPGRGSAHPLSKELNWCGLALEHVDILSVK
jgi:hypothetical protein